MMMGGWGSFGSFGWIGMLFNLLFSVGILALLVLGILWLARQAGFTGPLSSESRAGRTEQAYSVDTPLDIARRRLATGEITIEEFEQIKARLEG